LSRASKKAMMPMTPAAAMTTARTVPSTLRTTGLVNIGRDYTTLGRPLRLRQTDGRPRRPVRRPAREAPRGRAGARGDAAGLLRRPHPSGPERTRRLQGDAGGDRGRTRPRRPAPGADLPDAGARWLRGGQPRGGGGRGGVGRPPDRARPRGPEPRR